MDDNTDPIQPDELDGLLARFAALGPCALAVSGGSDSMALLVLFADWLRQRGQDPGRHAVLTVDHGLRSSSADEARAVCAAAIEQGFQHAVLAWEGPKPRAGIQAAARAARYRLMGDYMRSHGIGLLLTAHTRDDQAETVLMRLARGSGLDGLAAMTPLSPLGAAGDGDAGPADNQLWIGRPFLDVPKVCLRATLEARGVRWMEDPSNIAPEYERARLRSARPDLDALGLSPGMLALSAARLARARKAVEAMVDDLCDLQAGVVHVGTSGVVIIDRSRLGETAEEVALRLLERAILAAGGAGERVPLGKLESLLRAIWDARPSASGRWTLSRALITAEPSLLRVEREPGREPLPELSLAPGETALWDGRFRVSVSSAFTGGRVEVRPLGEAGVRELRRHRSARAELSARAAAAVPSFWISGEIVAAPTLGFWKTGLAGDDLEADFVGIENPRKTVNTRGGPGRPASRKS